MPRRDDKVQAVCTREVDARSVAFLLALLAPACASASGSPVAPPSASPAVDTDRAHSAAFIRAEDEAIGWLAAADPRLALRADTTAPESILKRVGLEAVLAEDATAVIRGGSLDLFAFRARAHALDQAASALAAFQEPLAEAGPLGSGLERPRLERELLDRLIAEERRRAKDEANLGEASGDLVRGIVATWTVPAAPQESLDRDIWVSRHLLEIRESLREPRPVTGPLDLDVALYPLERLLAPMQYPRGSAGVAEVRMAIDEDMRAMPKVDAPDRLAQAAKAHLGVDIDPAVLALRLQKIEQRLRALADHVLSSAPAGSANEIAARARDLLLVERPCAPVRDTRVRSMAPPPERSAICGAVRALAEEGAPSAALVALHDDVVLSLCSVLPSPVYRSHLLSQPEDEDIEALQHKARERPLLALGVALAAEILYSTEGTEQRLRAWQALGEAPLDIVAREVGAPGPR